MNNEREGDGGNDAKEMSKKPVFDSSVNKSQPQHSHSPADCRIFLYGTEESLPYSGWFEFL